jgi:hypothetical protein
MDGNNHLSSHLTLCKHSLCLFGSLPSLPYHPTAPFHNQSSVHPTFDERAHSTKPRAGGFNFPHPESSFAELQTFCNRTRQATASLSHPPVHQTQ